MGISKVTRNFQITIPRDVREAKNFHVGDKVAFLLKGDCVDLVKLDDKNLSAAAGLWSDGAQTGVEYTRRIRKEWNRRPRP